MVTAGLEKSPKASSRPNKNDAVFGSIKLQPACDHRTITGMVFLCALVSYWERVGFSIAFTDIAFETGLGDAEKGSVFAAFYCGFALTQILAGLEKEAASAALPQLSRLLTEALDFRRVHASGSAPEVRASADLVETEASSAMVSLVMRLSEVELSPLFLHFCEWKAAIATEDGSMRETLGGFLERFENAYRTQRDAVA